MLSLFQLLMEVISISWIFTIHMAFPKHISWVLLSQSSAFARNISNISVTGEGCSFPLSTLPADTINKHFTSVKPGQTTRSRVRTRSVNQDLQSLFHPQYTLTDFKTRNPGNKTSVAKGEGVNNMASVISTLFKSVTVINLNGDWSHYNQHCFMIHTVKLLSS